MKRTRNKEQTTLKILDSAEELFAEKGFSGTSMTMLSRRSGISTGLILHHYGTKDNLYKAVRERLARQYGEELLKNFSSGGDDANLLQATLETAIRFFMQNDHYKRIALWAYLEGREDLVETEARITSRGSSIINFWNN